MKKTGWLRACLAICLTVCLPLSAGAAVRGDVSADGSVSAADYIKVKRHVLGLYRLDGASLDSADINRDGEVNSTDYVMLKRFVLGTYRWESETAEPNPELSYAEQVLELVNAERAKTGLPALELRQDLCAVAADKARDMAELGYFDHTSPTYGTPFEMLADYGISYSSAGENIAAGQMSAGEVMQAWMNSAGHRANILNGGYTAIGVGVYNGGEYGMYWVQVFWAG